MNSNFNQLLIIFFILLFCIGCGKKTQAEMEKFSEGNPSYNDIFLEKTTGAFNESKSRNIINNNKKQDSQDLDFYLFEEFEKSKKRLLEYNINAEYECVDLNDARKILLEIVQQYGFIKRASSTIKDNTFNINANIYIEANLLYKALGDFKKIGKMISEDISINDHTENMMIQQKKAAREQIRVQRKIKSIENISTTNINWSERENSLEKSENDLDNTDIEKWKINDQIMWAKITLNINGPQRPFLINTPIYKNVLIGLINVFLQLLYILLWVVPFIIIILLAIVLVKKSNLIKIYKDKFK